jgi:hypothetical protein
MPESRHKGVGEDAEVRTFGNAKATNHFFTVNGKVKEIVLSRNRSKSFITGRLESRPFRVGR